MIILSMVFAVGAVGLNVISGFGGYVSLGQAAFVGVGAYTVALGALKVGGNPFIWVPAAGVGGGLLAPRLGPVAMRPRGGAVLVLSIAPPVPPPVVAINLGTVTHRPPGP